MRLNNFFFYRKDLWWSNIVKFNCIMRLSRSLLIIHIMCVRNKWNKRAKRNGHKNKLPDNESVMDHYENNKNYHHKQYFKRTVCFRDDNENTYHLELNEIQS